MAIIEIKCKSKLDEIDISQLRYYMTVGHVEHGFAINFPHVRQFSDIGDRFEQEVLAGENIVAPASARTLATGVHVQYEHKSVLIELMRKIALE